MLSAVGAGSEAWPGTLTGRELGATTIADAAGAAWGRSGCSHETCSSWESCHYCASVAVYAPPLAG